VNTSRLPGIAICLLLAGSGCASLSYSPPGSSIDQLSEIRTELERQRAELLAQSARLSQQDRLLQAQREQLKSQRAQIEQLALSPLSDRLLALAVGRGTHATGLQSTRDPAADGADSGKDGGTQAGPDDPQRSEPPREKVGEAPPEADTPPEIPAIADLGGVLTPRGVFVIEPAVQFSTQTLNRFVFSGTGLAPGLLLGQISATDADRTTFLSSLGIRYGVTNRLELNVKVPYVRRDDRQTDLIPSEADDVRIERNLRGSGIGDIEFGAHYQINQGNDGWPFFVGNVRVKSDTGVGPFQVNRDELGLETELPTGSGFWAVQPSVTAIYPTDPAVFYGNLSYLFNMQTSVDAIVNTGAGPAFFGKVDPGDAIGMSFGMGIGLNQRSSFNLGYDHQYVLASESVINGVRFHGETLQVGSFLFGLSYSVNETTGINLNVSMGATADAPDMQLGLRVPTSFDWF